MEKKFSKFNLKRNLQDNKFQETAKDLLEIVGKDNFSHVSNCMTRVRFYVYDKELIKEEKINKLELVKGYTWAGSELQVVIGGEAFKVKEFVEELRNKSSADFVINNVNSIKKQSLWQKFLAGCNGVIVPLLPFLILAGFTSGIGSILTSTNILEAAGPDNGFVTNMDLMSGLVYILSQTGITLLSIFFCYSTVKYMKGDAVIGILLGLMISSRFFMTHFISGAMDSGEWVLFKINDYPISIKAYNNSIIPAVGAAMVYVYLDRFIKKWMPRQVDIIFRPLLAFTITFFISFFFILPVLGVVEYAVGIAATWLFEIPYGIGGGLYGFIYQGAVLTGVAWPVALAIETPHFTDNTIPFRALTTADATTLAMFGTILALYFKQIKTKDKAASLGVLAPLIIGSSEPAVYGILVERPKAFWLGNVGGAVLGILMVSFHVTRSEIGGYGVLGILGNGSNYRNMSLYLLFGLVGAIVNFLLITFFYQEKNSESMLVKKNLFSLKLHLKLFNKNNEFSFLTMNKELKTILIQTKMDQKTQKQFYKWYLEYQKLLNKYENKQTKIKDKQKKIEEKARFLKSKNRSIKSLNKELSKLEKLFLENKKVETNVNSLKAQLDLEAKNLIVSNDDTYNFGLKSIANFLAKYNLDLDYQIEFKNKFWNSINDSLIVSGFLEAKPAEISKQDFYQTKNKFYLKFLPKIS